MATACVQDALKANKKAMRQVMSRVLGSITSNGIQDQSLNIAKLIVSLPAFQQSKTVSCYLSMPTKEVDTSFLISEILRAGKTLMVPRIDRTVRGRMDFLTIYGEDDLASLPSGVWGIKEPGLEWQGKSRRRALDGATDDLDLILMPGLAFDRSLRRLGHGMGYYDRFLSTYATSRKRPTLVALALREQILNANEVPTTESDWMVDMIATADEVITKDNGMDR